MSRSITLLLLGLLPLICQANPDFVAQAVKQSVKGSKITRVALRSIPHSTSMQMTIFTNKGENTLILSKSHVVDALKSLNDASIVGKENVSISQHYIKTNPHLQKYVTLTTATSYKSLKPAVAIANSSITAANQQASR